MVESNVSCGASSLDDAIEDEANEFHHILWIVFFITLVWVTGKCFHRIGCPALVGEIVVGGLLGPHFANVVPEHHALVLYGEVGLMLLVIEAGLDVDLEMLRLIGLRGLGVAISGSLAPLAIATTLSMGVLGLNWRSALAIGCTLAPTSMGVALNVLKRGKVLNTPTGQLVISAAVLDDIIALILLSELQALDDPSAVSLLLPIVSSAGLLSLGMFLGVKVVPGLMRRLKPRIPPKRLPKVLLGMLMLLALILVPLCHALGSSPLLGAFLSGLSFCTDRDVHDSWARQVKRLMQWLLRIFFAATIAFAVPINEFASLEVLKGAAILCVAVLGKVATGLWALPLNWGQFWTVGLAMSAWGEFAFVVATTARSAGLMDQRAFASVILAVVLSILVSPVLLRLVINRNHRTAVALIEGASARSRASLATGAKSLGAGSAAVPVHFQLRTVSAPTWGLNGRLFEALSAEKLIILDFRSQHDEARRQVTNELVVWARAKRACVRMRVLTTAPSPPSAQVTNELFVGDPSLLVPATLQLDEQAEARVRRRVGALLGVLRTLFADGGTVSLERWLPGVEQSDQDGAALLEKATLDVEDGPFPMAVAAVEGVEGAEGEGGSDAQRDDRRMPGTTTALRRGSSNGTHASGDTAVNGTHASGDTAVNGTHASGDTPVAIVSPSAELVIVVGDICTVVGLTQRADLNGTKARVVAHDTIKGLWHVLIDGQASKVALRPENLTAYSEHLKPPLSRQSSVNFSLISRQSSQNHKSSQVKSSPPTPFLPMVQRHAVAAAAEVEWAPASGLHAEEDEGWLASGYKAQRVSLGLDGFVAESRDMRARQKSSFTQRGSEVTHM